MPRMRYNITVVCQKRIKKFTRDKIKEKYTKLKKRIFKRKF